MDVSVIIPTFNNAEMLATTLTALELVHFPKESELIVVDNNSSDATAETIKSFKGRLPIKYIFEPKQGTSAAKNGGIKIAKGKLLIFTDDDVRPCPEWLTIYLNEYKKNPERYFWGGPVISEFEDAELDKRLIHYAPPSVRGLDFGPEVRILEEKEYFVGANMVFPSKAVKEVRGFDTTLGLNYSGNTVLVGEEDKIQLLLKSKGYQAMYLPTTPVRHVVPSSKCTLKHLADRREANGRYLRSITPVDKGPRTFNGVPLWRYRMVMESWILSWAKRFTGLNWYPDYFIYRHGLGFLRGIPKPKKELES